MKSLGKAGFGILALFIALWVIGCTSPLYKDNCIAEVKISAAKLNDSAIANSQSYAQNVYRSGAQPRWLYKRVNIKSNRLPLDLLMNKLLPSNRVGLQYQLGIDRNQPIIINYNGQIRGALDKIATQTGYAYDIKNNILTWSPYVTKTFDISFMLGASQCLKGEKESGSSMNISSTINNGHAATRHINDTQFSNLQTTPLVWKDLENSIKQMLSQDGKVMVSKSTITVTVRDHPQNVQVVADYFARMNGNVYLQLTSELSSLDSITTFQFSQGSDAIQLPNVSREHFNMRSMLPSGSTLIIASFKKINRTSKQASIVGALGGQGTDQSNTEIIMLITPTVLGSNN